MTPKWENRPESEPRREAQGETLRFEKETLRDLDVQGDDVRGGAPNSQSYLHQTKQYPCN